MEEEKNQNSNQNQNPNYISLFDAAKFCSYSETYLRLRARQGKLKSIKLGKKWMTTREWLDDYEAGVAAWRAAAESKKIFPATTAIPPEIEKVVEAPARAAIFCAAPPPLPPMPPRRLAGFGAGQIFPPPRPSEIERGSDHHFIGALAGGALTALLFFAAANPDGFSGIINFSFENAGQANLSRPVMVAPEIVAPFSEIKPFSEKTAITFERSALEELVAAIASWFD